MCRECELGLITPPQSPTSDSEDEAPKKRVNYGPPTDSDVEPEIVLVTGTASRPLPNADIAAANTLLDLIFTPTRSFITSSNSITTSTTSSTSATTSSTSATTSSTPQITFIDLTTSDVSDDDTVLLANHPIARVSSSAFSRPPGRLCKRPLRDQSITRPIRPVPMRAPVVELRDLPPITGDSFYSSYDLTLQNIMWHSTASSSSIPAIHLKDKPRWLSTFAFFIPGCPYTNYLHKLFIQCPCNNWRPCTRSMVVSFRNAIQYAPPGVAECISCNFHVNEEYVDGLAVVEPIDDDSVTVTEEDDVGNESLFLFRFWTNLDPRFIHFSPHREFEIRANKAIGHINYAISQYDNITDLINDHIVEVDSDTEVDSDNDGA